MNVPKNNNILETTEIDPKKAQQFEKILRNYCDVIKQGLFIRWKLLSLDLSQTEFFEVIGGLLSCQANLGIQFAMNPPIWNGYISPIIFRTLIDTYITVSWILQDSGENRLKRAQDYILYGLGQEKLHIEHLKVHLETKHSTETEFLINMRTKWLNSQQFDFLTKVNIGSWSGKTTRDMAKEAGCQELYNGAYQPFSSATHSTWNHVARYNLKRCDNPLHKYHRVPFIGKTNLSLDDLIQSAKYIQKAYQLVDKKMKLYCKVPLPQNYLLKCLESSKIFL